MIWLKTVVRAPNLFMPSYIHKFLLSLVTLTLGLVPCLDLVMGQVENMVSAAAWKVLALWGLFFLFALGTLWFQVN